METPEFITRRAQFEGWLKIANGISDFSRELGYYNDPMVNNMWQAYLKGADDECAKHQGESLP